MKKGEELMRVVCIAAGCVSLLTTFGTMTSFAAEVSNPFIQQEAARADASLRQRAEAPMTGAALPRSESAYTGLDKVPMKSLPKESISFAIEHIVVTSSEPVLQKIKIDCRYITIIALELRVFSFLQKRNYKSNCYLMGILLVK